MKEKLDKGLIFALKMKWVIMQLIVVNNNLRFGPILAASCTRLTEQQHKKTTSFFQLRFKYICCDVKLLIFCLPVIVLFDNKFDTDRFTAAVRRVFFRHPPE